MKRFCLIGALLISISTAPAHAGMVSMALGELTAQWLARQTTVPFAGLGYHVGRFFQLTGEPLNARNVCNLAIRAGMAAMAFNDALKQETSSWVGTLLLGGLMETWGARNANACIDAEHEPAQDQSMSGFAIKNVYPAALAGYLAYRNVTPELITAARGYLGRS